MFSYLHINISTGIGALIPCFLFVFRDSLSQSPGKILANIEVIKLDGGKVTFIESFLRNMTLGLQSLGSIFLKRGSSPEESITGVFTIWMLIGTILIAVEFFLATRTSDGRRLGDQIAGTAVNDLKSESADGHFLFWSFVALVINMFLVTQVTKF